MIEECSRLPGDHFRPLSASLTQAVAERKERKACSIIGNDGLEEGNEGLGIANLSTAIFSAE